MKTQLLNTPSAAVIAERYPTFQTNVKWMAVALDQNEACKPILLEGPVDEVLENMEDHFDVGLDDSESNSVVERITMLQECNGNVIQLFVVDIEHNFRVI